MKTKLFIEITEKNLKHICEVIIPTTDINLAMHTAFHNLQVVLDDNSPNRVLEVIKIEQLQ